MGKTTIAIHEEESEAIEELMELMDANSKAEAVQRLVEYFKDNLNEKTRRKLGEPLNQKNYA